MEAIRDDAVCMIDSMIALYDDHANVDLVGLFKRCWEEAGRRAKQARAEAKAAAALANEKAKEELKAKERTDAAVAKAKALQHAAAKRVKAFHEAQAAKAAADGEMQRQQAEKQRQQEAKQSVAEANIKRAEEQKRDVQAAKASAAAAKASAAAAKAKARASLMGAKKQQQLEKKQEKAAREKARQEEKSSEFRARAESIQQDMLERLAAKAELANERALLSAEAAETRAEVDIPTEVTEAFQESVNAMAEVLQIMAVPAQDSSRHFASSASNISEQRLLRSQSRMRLRREPLLAWSYQHCACFECASVIHVVTLTICFDNTLPGTAAFVGLQNFGSMDDDDDDVEEDYQVIHDISSIARDGDARIAYQQEQDAKRAAMMQDDYGEEGEPGEVSEEDRASKSSSGLNADGNLPLEVIEAIVEAVELLQHRTLHTDKELTDDELQFLETASKAFDTKGEAVPATSAVGKSPELAIRAAEARRWVMQLLYPSTSTAPRGLRYSLRS